jgi:polar amino acid transport system ATP-binding protein
MTCVLVTHEMRFAEEISDVVYFTENGLITESGSAEQIFQHPHNDRTREFLRHALGESGRRQYKPAPDVLSNLGRYSLSV